MEKETWYDYFLNSLYAKYPKKNQLAEALMDLLFIEREAAYRRLRKDVVFTFHEIVKIAVTWNISLNEIIGLSVGNIPFFLRPLSYINPSEVELNILKEATEFLQKLDPTLEPEYMEICNKLPRSMISGFKWLNQFYLFKWMYQYVNEKETIPFVKTIVPDEMNKIMVDYYDSAKNISTLSFILDQMLFDFLVCDVRYFHSIKLITDEEKELIKADTHALLNQMSIIARQGYFREEKNKINIYVSQVNIDTNYYYLYTNAFKVCGINVFNKYEIYTTDNDCVMLIRKWMQLKKRTSILISEVDEKTRIDYFDRQHKLVDSL